MSGHTPEPWWRDGREVGSSPIMDIKVGRIDGADYSQATANARRIVACVNACAGMPTEEIESYGFGALAECARNWARKDQ